MFNPCGNGSVMNRLIDQLLAISGERFLQVFIAADEYGLMATIEILDGSSAFQAEHEFKFG